MIVVAAWPGLIGLGKKKDEAPLDAEQNREGV
jgi:hypothetical protein